MKSTFRYFRRTAGMVYLGLPLVLVVLLAWAALAANHTAFDDSRFSVDGAYRQIQELSSAKYEGRLAGTEGNQRALKDMAAYFRSIGIAPAGENQSYFQSFQSMVPSENQRPRFQIFDEYGRTVADYQIGKDYREDLTGYGGTGKAVGKLYYLNQDVHSYQRQMLQGKVLLLNNLLNDADMEYLIDSGIQGILTTSRAGLNKVPAAIVEKKGKSVPIHVLSQERFAQVLNFAEKHYRAKFTYDASYKLVDTPNLLGMIPGKGDGYVIFSAHIDGLGQEFDGRYFPGALDGASGVGMLLELAKALKAQATKPEKTIIFAFWNNELFGLAGSKHYATHPLYPLGKSQLVDLNFLGNKDNKEVYIDSAGDLGDTVRSKLKGYADDLSLKVLVSDHGESGSQASFLTAGVPVAFLSEVNPFDPYSLDGLHNYSDTIENISKTRLAEVAGMLLSYAKGEGFGNMFPDYLGAGGLMWFLLILGLMAFLYLIYLGARFAPGAKLFHFRIEDIYHSLPYYWLVKGFFYLVLLLGAVLAIVLIGYFPHDFNLQFLDAQTVSNYSPYLGLKKAILYIGDLLRGELGVNHQDVKVYDVVTWSFFRSFKLIAATLIFSFVVGVIKGTLDGYRRKDKALVALVMLSLPDILVIVLSQELIMFLGRHRWLTSVIGLESVTGFVVPMLCLAILPSVYISRMAATAVQEEMRKEYVKAARAKGQSSYVILVRHLLPVIVLKVLDALPSVLTMMLSNLMIIEYVYYYPGIIYNLFSSYEKNDALTFIGLSLALGLIYLLLTALIKGIVYVINPLKRGGL